MIDRSRGGVIHEGTKIFQEHAIRLTNVKHGARNISIIYHESSNPSIYNVMNATEHVSSMKFLLDTRRVILVDLQQVVISTMLDLTYIVCQKTWRKRPGFTRHTKTHAQAEQALQNRTGPVQNDLIFLHIQ